MYLLKIILDLKFFIFILDGKIPKAIWVDEERKREKDFFNFLTKITQREINQRKI